MSYATIESSARTILINSTATFNSTCVVSVANNTPAGYQRILDEGESRTVVFLRPGAFAYGSVTLGEYAYQWQTIIEIWTRELNPGETEHEANRLRQHVLDEFNKYERLNNATGVYDSAITAGDESEYRAKERGGGRRYIVQKCTLATEERVRPTISD